MPVAVKLAVNGEGMAVPDKKSVGFVLPLLQEENVYVTPCESVCGVGAMTMFCCVGFSATVAGVVCVMLRIVRLRPAGFVMKVIGVPPEVTTKLLVAEPLNGSWLARSLLTRLSPDHIRRRH